MDSITPIPSQPTVPEEIPKRILSLEGGGVRGVFSLQILLRMEQLLRRHYRRVDLVLADHFHLIAGTSVGAILGTFLSWGWSVADLIVFFEKSLPQIFSRSSWWNLQAAAFRRGPLREILQREFAEADGQPALFGSQRLKTWLMIILRNLSTGSVWPLINHPSALFNKSVRPDGSDNPASNLRLPLWQLVRASSAAPWFFPPERVALAPGQTAEFVDGGLTGHNNPNVIAFLMATLPCYPLRWPQGVDRLHLISVGTGRPPVRLKPSKSRLLSRFRVASIVPASLMQSASQEQDLLMRALGRCEHGEPIDQEVGTLAGPQAVGSALRYSRYNRVFSEDEIRQACASCRTSFTLASVRLMPWLKDQGQRHAEETVRLEHLI